jgi:hypothetical protein
MRGYLRGGVYFDIRLTDCQREILTARRYNLDVGITSFTISSSSTSAVWIFGEMFITHTYIVILAMIVCIIIFCCIAHSPTGGTHLKPRVKYFNLPLQQTNKKW